MITVKSLQNQIDILNRKCCCNDTILPFNTLADFPAEGAPLRLYVDRSNGNIYFWDGNSYEPASGVGLWGAITGTLSNQTDLQAELDAKQDTLVSATNIKTVNSNTLLGSGNVFISKSGSYSQALVAIDVITITFGGTQPNNTYKVHVTPTSATAAELFYIDNKTTTTFDVTYLSPLTGTVSFDWTILQ